MSFASKKLENWLLVYYITINELFIEKGANSYEIKIAIFRMAVE